MFDTQPRDVSDPDMKRDLKPYQPIMLCDTLPSKEVNCRTYHQASSALGAATRLSPELEAEYAQVEKNRLKQKDEEMKKAVKANTALRV